MTSNLALHMELPLGNDNYIVTSSRTLQGILLPISEYVLESRSLLHSRWAMLTQ
jgi:hypothetical protein